MYSSDIKNKPAHPPLGGFCRSKSFCLIRTMDEAKGGNDITTTINCLLNGASQREIFKPQAEIVCKPFCTKKKQVTKVCMRGGILLDILMGRKDGKRLGMLTKQDL